MPAEVSDSVVNVGGADIRLLKGGSGAPLLLLHSTEGRLGWLRYAQALADRFTVYLPSHPGFDGSDRPDWLKTMSDLVCFYTWFLETQGLEEVRVIGFGLGGWLAAEMAATTRHAFSKLMLVDAAGIRPRTGEIVDIFIISPAQIAALTFHDPSQVAEYDQLYNSEPTPDQREIEVQNREMAVRLTWKPYMHDPRLPQLLARVNAPTRIVWGREDHLIPLECGKLYQQAIPGSELVVLDRCGHAPHLEKPDEFVAIAMQFLP
jgi:pimeloyl-ACP methyl ester carboxylesterase